MARVTIVAMREVFDSALALTTDVLRTAQWIAHEERRSQLVLRTVSVDGSPVASAMGHQIPVDGDLSELPDAGVVVVPGFWAKSREQVQARLAEPDIVAVAASLRHAHAAGRTIAAGCTGTFVVGESTLLDGHLGTTTWWLADLFAQRYPAIKVDVNRMVTHANRVMCSGAAMAHMDLSLALVEHVVGPALADRVGRLLLLEGRASQAKYMALEQLGRQHQDVVRAEAWVRQHLHEPFTIGDLARALGMSARTLNRRFSERLGFSPQRLVRRIRVDVAVHLLETTDLPIDGVATRVGHAGAASLRRAFRAETGRAPSAYRSGVRGLGGSE